MGWNRGSSYDAAYMGAVVVLLEAGEGYRSLARRLGVSPYVTREWVRSYRIGGRAALMEEHGRRTYDYETKIAAVRDHLERGMTREAVMGRYGIVSMSSLRRWCSAYREGGPEALRPKVKGRPRGARSRPKPALTREQELELENEYLRTKVAYLEKVRALLDSKPRDVKRR